MKKIAMVFVCLLFSFALYGKTAYVISIPNLAKFEQKTINGWYASYIKKHYKIAETLEADLILLEIDTPGGSVASMFDIKDTILNSKIESAAFISGEALSAGAFIALSCKYVFMKEGSSIGAATPVVISNMSLIKASEKNVSAMRSTIRGLASRYNRNTKIAEAMVDEDVVLSRAEDGLDLEKGKLLTLTASEAFELGFINGKAETYRDVISGVGMEEAQIVYGKMDLTDSVFRFLSNPFILVLLIAAGIIGVFVEIKTPGFGIGGSISVISFALFFMIQIISGGAHWIAPALFLLGVIFLLLEIFVIPGFGVAGVMGIVSMLAGMFLSFGVDKIEEGVTVLFFASIVSVVAIVVLARFLPKSSFIHALSLGTTQNESYKVSETYESLLGKEAIVLGTLRPAGVIILDGQRYDAVSEGAYIDKDTVVKVIKVEGNRIVVRVV